MKQVKQEKQVCAIDQVIAQAGNQRALARVIGVSQQVVSQWQRQGWVPPRRAAEIARQYGVNAFDLLPAYIRRMTSAA
jgi:DNA-binding transcriptional regulator YdaS (Cro superfamily)